jgi:branched-chain amino acid transport system substrate-binding protein
VAEEGPYYIGVVQDLSGSVSEIGIASKNGAHLAADQINSQGGINGRLIELVDYDDRCEPQGGANVANLVAQDDRILAVAGHECSSACLAALPIYTKAGIVELSTACSSPALSGASPYFFRIIVTDAFQGDFGTRWMLEEGYKRIAIVYANDDYGVGVKDTVAAAVPKYGGEVVALEAFTQGETKDFTATITKLKELNPDAVYYAGYHAEAALLLMQAAELGWRPPIFSTDCNYTPALIELGGEAVEGFRAVSFFHPTNQDPLVQEFVKAYEASFGTPPDTWAANGYDAVRILAEAIRAKGGSREGIREFLSTLEGFKGATGITTFDQNGDSLKDPLKLIIQNGEWVIYTK